MVYLHGKLPATDPKTEYPKGVDPARTYSISSEYVYGYLARAMPDTFTLTQKIRILQVLWFCLGIPAIAVVIQQVTRSSWCGWLGGLMYAVSLASVMRSTGVEISRENFALPLLLIHLGFWVRYLDRRRLAPLIGSALFLAAAMMSWDLIQFYLALWVLGYGVLSRAGEDSGLEPLPVRAWGVHAGVLILAGCLHPYLLSHGFLLSIGMLLLYGVCLRGVQTARTSQRPHSGVGWTLLLFPLVLGLLIGRVYSSGYGHFGDLLLAKIRYLNVKPEDPSLLSYAQRIMWVPALHSADWRLTRMLFPTTIILSLVGVVLTLTSRYFTSNRDGKFFLFGYAVSLLLFIFFVRFHVFLIFFASLFAVAPIAVLKGRSALAAAIWSVFVLGGISLEAAHTLNGEWGRKNVYYPELAQLTEYLDKHVAPQPVLANFGVSASILAYGRCPILLHPKFETEAIRNRVRDYADVLFKGNELEFRDWADREGAHYYVYSKGGYAKTHPEYQMRYFVDALDPAPDTIAWRFEKQSNSFTYFQPVYGNRKYQVYKIVTRDIEQQAADLAIEASVLEKQERYALAYEKAQAALALFPFEPVALRVADRVSTRSQ
jgi:hypothetical protein